MQLVQKCLRAYHIGTVVATEGVGRVCGCPENPGLLTAVIMNCTPYYQCHAHRMHTRSCLVRNTLWFGLVSAPRYSISAVFKLLIIHKSCASFSIASVIFLYECRTVEWSRPPKYVPIACKEWSVNSRAK